MEQKYSKEAIRAIIDEVLYEPNTDYKWNDETSYQETAYRFLEELLQENKEDISKPEGLQEFLRRINKIKYGDIVGFLDKYGIDKNHVDRFTFMKTIDEIKEKFIKEKRQELKEKRKQAKQKKIEKMKAIWDQFIEEQKVNLLTNTGYDSFLEFIEEKFEELNIYDSPKDEKLYITYLTKEYVPAKQKERMEEYNNVIDEMLQGYSIEQLTSSNILEVENECREKISTLCAQSNFLEEIENDFNMRLESSLVVLKRRADQWEKIKNKYLIVCLENPDFTNSLTSELIMGENPDLTFSSKEIETMILIIKQKLDSKIQSTIEKALKIVSLLNEEALVEVWDDIIDGKDLRNDIWKGIEISNEDYSIVVKKTQEAISEYIDLSDLVYQNYIYQIHEYGYEDVKKRLTMQDIQNTSEGRFLTNEEILKLIEQIKEDGQKIEIDYMLEQTEIKAFYMKTTNLIDIITPENESQYNEDKKRLKEELKNLPLSDLEVQILVEFIEKYYQEHMIKLEYEKEIAQIKAEFASCSTKKLMDAIHNLDAISPICKKYQNETIDILCEQLVEHIDFGKESYLKTKKHIDNWSEKNNEAMNIPVEYTDKIKFYLSKKLKKFEEKFEGIITVGTEVTVSPESEVLLEPNSIFNEEREKYGLKKKTTGIINGYIIKDSKTNNTCTIQYMDLLKTALMRGCELIEYEIKLPKYKKENGEDQIVYVEKEGALPKKKNKVVSTLTKGFKSLKKKMDNFISTIKESYQLDSLEEEQEENKASIDIESLEDKIIEQTKETFPESKEAKSVTSTSQKVDSLKNNSSTENSMNIIDDAIRLNNDLKTSQVAPLIVLMTQVGTYEVVTNFEDAKRLLVQGYRYIGITPISNISNNIISGNIVEPEGQKLNKALD